LHTPEFVARPNLDGRMITPAATGPVVADRTGAGPDSDGDAILDVADKCPLEGEAYNGFEDVDGCPDRGMVVVTDANIRILEQIYFRKDSAELQAESRQILDAVAAVLASNPDITRVDVAGHASEDEADPWGLSTRRASAVRTALVAKGVAVERLSLVPFGPTRPIDLKTSERNRRVEFEIAKRGSVPPPTDGIEAKAAARTLKPPSIPKAAAGTVRYVLGEPVTITRGSSTLVSILNARVPGEDVFLF